MRNEILGRGRPVGHSKGEASTASLGGVFAGSGEDCKGKEELTGNRWSLFLSPVKPGDQEERKVRAPQGRVVRNPDCPEILKPRISR